MTGPILLVLLSVIILPTFAGIGYGAYRILNPTRSASDRLAELSDVERPEVLDIGGNQQAPPNPLVEFLARLAAPQTDEDRVRLRQMLIQAGYRNRRAGEIFNAIRVSAAVGLPMLLAPLLPSLGLMKAAGFAAFTAALGYYGPLLSVRSQGDARRALLLKSFPDALDLLVSSVEAGLGLDAAFRRVSSELETSAPELARELQGVNYEIGAGVPRTQALRHLEERTGLDEIRSLVNMLVQAERFGSSVAKSLRVHSRSVRNKRMSQAEEKAAQVSPKLTVVMILFLLPVLMMLLGGPAGIRVYQSLAGG